MAGLAEKIFRSCTCTRSVRGESASELSLTPKAARNSDSAPHNLQEDADDESKSNRYTQAISDSTTASAEVDDSKTEASLIVCKILTNDTVSTRSSDDLLHGTSCASENSEDSANVPALRIDSRKSTVIRLQRSARRLACKWLQKIHLDQPVIARMPSLVIEPDQLEALTRSRSTEPLAKHRISGASVEAIRDVFFFGDQRSPSITYLRDSMGCEDISSTPWVPIRATSEAMMQRMRYEMPMSKDLPDAVTRIVNIPEMLKSTTVTCAALDGGVFTVVQDSCSQGVMYIDRFYVRLTHVFADGGNGDVEWSEWCDIIWTEPLPWTYGIIRKIMEKTVKTEAKAQAPEFARLVQAALT